MAASQIGDLVAAHPSETSPVLRRVRRLLRSPAWETRIAAGQAIAAIAEHSPRFVPQPAQSKSEKTLPRPPSLKDELVKSEDLVVDEANSEPLASSGQNPSFPQPSAIIKNGLRFDKLDIDKLMDGGAMLFGSSGDEYKGVEMSVAEQRARLKADLGLDDRFSSGGDMLGLKDEDLLTRNSRSEPTSSPNGITSADHAPTADVVAEMSGEGMSARERNRLKRLAKRKAKHGGDPRSMRPPKRPRGKGPSESGEVASSTPEAFSLSEMASQKDEEDEEYERGFGSNYWDFQATCEILKHALLETRWEWRHGAAIGLRQILMRHAQSAGRCNPGSLGDEENARWLEDICCRLLCVLAMDRFGDFVGDAVVAPVREAAAMTIGAAIRVMSPESTRVLVERLFYLLKTQKSSQWEVRHASLLGARYVLAVKEDMARELLEFSFEIVVDGLRDQDDDVRAVAAEALLPVAPQLVEFMPKSVSKLTTTLWEALLDLDDISASTSSVMRLLSEITNIPSHPECNALWLEPDALRDESEDDDVIEDGTRGIRGLGGMRDRISDLLVDLVPRLWPFLRHSAKSVRRASMTLLHTLTTSFDDADLLRWVRPICAELYSRLFRNIILETEEDILEISKLVWERTLRAFGNSQTNSRVLVQCLEPLLGHWIAVSAQETRAEAASYDETRNKPKTSAAARRRKAAAARRAAKLRKAKGAGSAIPQTIHDGDTAPTEEGPYDGVLMQRNASTALGLLACLWPREDSSLETHLLQCFESPFALSRRVACDILQAWAQASKQEDFVYSERVTAVLHNEVSMNGGCRYAEVGMVVGSFFTDTFSYLEALPPKMTGLIDDVSSLKTACEQGKDVLLARDIPAVADCARSIKPNVANLVMGDTWTYIETTSKKGGMPKRRFETIESVRYRILSSLGFITLKEDESKWSLAASATFALVSARGCPLPSKVSPMIKAAMAAVKSMRNPHLQRFAGETLSNLAHRLSETGAKKPLPLLLKNLLRSLTAAPEASKESLMASVSSPPEKALDSEALAKRGALLALRELCLVFGSNLFSSLPWLWERVSSTLKGSTLSDRNAEVKHAMTILRGIVGHAAVGLHSTISSLLPDLIRVCAAPHDGYSECAPQCLADVVAAVPSSGMQCVVTQLVPLLSGSQDDRDADLSSRRGAATALRAVVDRLGASLIPYAAFMIVPMMTRMVDEDEIVRDAAAGVFGTLVRLMPLEGGAPDDPEMSESLSQERRDARSFLGQLLGSEPRAHYELPVSIGDEITLRKYQQECLDWLAFLNKYGLHGALCDDMGLGKTLMTLCMITGDYMINSKQGRRLPSIVVCPSTIVAHWFQEAERFFGHALKHIVQYAGLPKARARIRGRVNFKKTSLIITSYDILSNDLQYFEPLRWNYLVLDEGHVIKNSKTKVARAVRSISSDHRLILTGTPIQNSVLELWSMFDFLMPGFLGTEKSFKETYAKPIMASRDGKCSEAEQERGMVATEALHRQVLPFVLRRLKDDVLSELPPKIMQDYYCYMTPLQLRLYEDFASDFASGNGVQSSESADKKSRTSHIFQALSYMRRLCSHPKLVLTPQHPEYAAVRKSLRDKGKSIDDIESSAKLVGLMNILSECGIGQPQSAVKDSGGHRVLIFAQLKQMLDLVESDLFGTHMPDVTYLRLDGSVETSKRQSIVTRFNADPTIDCLLLTTHVGGLGLNLTGADTVIFLEHDWNPTKDLQAMDRAHRMGQKRTVNVYRLITRGTLEEKIMGIQRFKTHIANTVVNRDNSNLQNMHTEQLLDLFKIDNAESGAAGESNGAMTFGARKGVKAALAGLGELWEESQYDDEYNMDEFLSGMGPSPENKT